MFTSLASEQSLSILSRGFRFLDGTSQLLRVHDDRDADITRREGFDDKPPRRFLFCRQGGQRREPDRLAYHRSPGRAIR